MASMPRRALTASLDLAQEAAQQGDWITAHRICVQLTHENPANEAAWLLGAATARSVEEALLMLSHVLKLNPLNEDARQAFHESLQELLHQDAFLAYVQETDDSIYVRTARHLEFMLPNERAVRPAAALRAQAATRWLGWAVLGLIPAGLGTLVCAPLAMLAALELLAQPERAGRRHGAVVLGASVVLLALALMLVALLVAHFS